MEKRLNSVNTRKAMEQAGLSQSAIAQELGVSKEAVSQWLNDKSFPRPNKLLQLGKLLRLRFDDLVIKEDPFMPKVAFRKMKGTKTTDQLVEKARVMGTYLRQIVDYLPFSTLEMPPILKSPVCNYDYLCQVTDKVRAEIHVGSTDTIDFNHLIKRFGELQAVIVPVLWGSKKVHENAVHIYLPDSQTTWVYLNLDTNVHDFKFWMAHELGHCLSPDLEGEEAEDFADAFAGSLLFPHQLAEPAYFSISQQQSPAKMISHIIDLANDQTISPYTVLKQVNHFAAAHGKPLLELDGSFHGAVTNFNRKYLNLSDALFSRDASDVNWRPNTRQYIEETTNAFETPIFDVLRKYLSQQNKGPGFIQTVLDVPLLDARSIYAELT
jgi:transcriptional regulator with XRE-family HTH domain